MGAGQSKLARRHKEAEEEGEFVGQGGLPSAAPLAAQDQYRGHLLQVGDAAADKPRSHPPTADPPCPKPSPTPNPPGSEPSPPPTPPEPSPPPSRRRQTFSNTLPDPLKPNVVVLPETPPKTAPPPPLPSCRPDILATASLTNLDALQTSDVTNILTLVASIFEAPVALIATYGDRKVYIRNARGMPQVGMAYEVSICAWLLGTEHPTNLVVEDVALDDRFCSNCVLLQNGFRAYCGAPLIASNGHRLGSIAFLDKKPRAIGASMCQVLNNFSELVVRELERDIALQLQQHASGRLQQVYRQLVRGLDCFRQALLLVEATEERWQVLHCNQAWSSETGLQKEYTIGRTIWALFEHINGTQLGLGKLRDAQDAGGQFSITDIAMRGSWDGRPITLTFRQASTDTVDDDTQRIGVPPMVSPCTDTGFTRNFYFITLAFHHPPSADADAGSPPASWPHAKGPTSHHIPALGPRLQRPPSPASPCPVPGLKTTTLLGGSRRVFRGTWYGSEVAVKVLQGTNYSYGQVQELRAGLGSQLTHPNIVTTLTVASCPVSRDKVAPARSIADSAGDHVCDSDCSTSHSDTSLADSAASMEEGGMEVWLVLEFCDKGHLLDAVERGALHCTGGSSPHARVLATALEVARAMAYLHERGVVHGALCATNVLLSSRGCAADDGRGFVAKVGNFTSAHSLLHNQHVVANGYSSHHSYHAPEVLRDALFSKPSDVYAFGVLLWQLHTQLRPWLGLSPEDLLQRRPPLNFPGRVPYEYQELTHCCMAANPEDRPTFAELCELLQAMLADCEAEGPPSDALPAPDYMAPGAANFIQSL